MAASKDVGSSAKLVWMVLADMARSGNEVFFQVATIGERAGLAERQTRDCLRELEGAGWLSTEQREGATSVYSPMLVTPALSAGGGGTIRRGTPAVSAPKSEHLSPNKGEEEAHPPRRFKSQDPDRAYADAAAAKIVDRFVTISRERWGDEVPPDALDLKACRDNHAFLSRVPRWLERAMEYHEANGLPHTLVSLIDTVRRGKLEAPRDPGPHYRTADEIEAAYQAEHGRLHGTL